MKRKPGSLVPLEVAICETAADLRHRNIGEFHGYEIAKSLAKGSEQRLLTAYGTLYRALGRLQKMGLLDSRWEEPELSASESRPRRRLYRLTPSGEAVVAEAREAARALKRPRRRLAPA